MATYELRQTAYVKLVLHALKHSTSAVNGVLIGRVGAGEGKSTGVEVTDCVPLFHGQLGLLPMLELALLQVDEYLASGKDASLQIVGYYHANEQFDNYELGSVGKKIGDHIARHCPQAGILLLDNRQLVALAKGGSSKVPVVQLYVREGSSWRLAGPGGADLRLKEATANSILSDYIKEERERRVVDFDEHLDDVSKDWLNPTLFN
ncbi:hypothetical protein KC19_2G077900 [Ceratodon purpureus]|uniref:MPN domain-containing protein n=1 Tax=Ceratodon purpureus TaxID=3225 RepID=A0A8T0IRB9_CERPU|nr:hypothetical protein KC19_2G077900 [Ceratodon purpureus]